MMDCMESLNERRIHSEKNSKLKNSKMNKNIVICDSNLVLDLYPT